MTHSLLGDGSAYVCIDLGGVYNVTRIVFFNRNTNSARTQGATVWYRNGFGELVGSSVLGSALIQTYDVVLYPPSE